jgi:glycine/D-amino acid oxidase-like deaminating enzyme
LSTADVAVIGAGVVGAAIADALTREGCSVAVVESQFAGAGSTGAAMGHLAVMDDSPAQLRLCHHSRTRWATMLDDLPAAVETDQCGTLWLAADDAELTVAEAKVARFRREGVSAELLDAAALAEAEPALRRGLAGALRVPDDLVCYPPAIARALLERAISRGATLHQPQRAIAIEAGRIRSAYGETISAGVVVVAAGAHSAGLLPGLPVMPRKGHLCITDRVPIRINHQLVELGYLDTAHTLGGASVAFNVQPRRTGQLLVGSSRELVGFDPAINRPLLARMLHRAAEYVPALRSAPMSRTWVGFRPATVDALPLIGRWPAMERVWVATGHEGLGITMAPGSADLVVAGILGRQPPLDPAPYRPDRDLAAHPAAA